MDFIKKDFAEEKERRIGKEKGIVEKTSNEEIRKLKRKTIRKD